VSPRSAPDSFVGSLRGPHPDGTITTAKVTTSAQIVMRCDTRLARSVVRRSIVMAL
jgi:hypothetical protein